MCSLSYVKLLLIGESYGFQSIPMDSNGFPAIPYKFFGFQWIPNDAYGFLWIGNPRTGNAALCNSSVAQLNFAKAGVQVPVCEPV